LGDQEFANVGVVQGFTPLTVKCVVSPMRG
jgi:hypothetical protein